MKKIPLISFALLAVLACSAALAQFAHVPVSVILDNTAFEGFGGKYRENSDDFTKGGSSLEVIPPSNLNSGVTGGFFIDGNQTITFDYKYDSTGLLEPLEMIYSHDGEIRGIPLQTSNGGWCRRSIYVSEGPNTIQWSVIFAESPFRGKILFDNFRIVDGRKIQSFVCDVTPQPEPTPEPEPAPAEPNNAGMSAVYSLLFEDEAVTPPPVLTEPGTVSGTISLPAGLTAGVSGVQVEVSTFPIDFEFEPPVIRSTRDTVTIPQGQNSVDYFIDLFAGANGDTRQLEFECTAGCESLDVVTSGFWSDTRGAVGFFSATNYPVFANNDVDIDLATADTFSGSIDLPAGVLTNGTEQFAIRVRETVASGGIIPESYTAYVYPTAGLSGIPFSMGVPSGSTTPNWTLSVSCLGCEPGVVISDQYATAVNGGTLDTNPGNAHSFPRASDYGGITLAMLATP